MVDGINFNNISYISRVENKTIQKTNNGPPHVGFKGPDPPVYSTGIERNVVPEALASKFESVEIPKYNKNIAQLTIADKDYIPDQAFEECKLCET